jgi:hypothetical protein
MAPVRNAVSLEGHSPEAIAYLSGAVGRELPQPRPVAGVSGGASEDDSAVDDEGTREPRVRGRAPIFEPGQRSIASLVSDVERGVIALPDLQRPFVWENRHQGPRPSRFVVPGIPGGYARPLAYGQRQGCPGLKRRS